MPTRWVIWSDVHVPFQSPVETDLTLRFLDWYKPDVAIPCWRSHGLLHAVPVRP
jgi:hypothetical protein